MKMREPGIISRWCARPGEPGAWNGYQNCRSLRREYSRLSAHTATTQMADDAIPERATKRGAVLGPLSIFIEARP